MSTSKLLLINVMTDVIFITITNKLAAINAVKERNSITSIFLNLKACSKPNCNSFQQIVDKVAKKFSSRGLFLAHN